jgi:UDP-N-acetylmuramyl-tripeptide synthetase
MGQAMARGAAAILAEKAPDACTIPLFLVTDSRKALALAAAAFYGFPSASLHLTGVTGTNGKTSTTYLIEAIFTEAGLRTGVIGTINIRYAGQVLDNPMTTPESLHIQRILADMKGAGVTHVIMEVSSHAVDLDRIVGLSFDTGVFTNLSQDHLDYHDTMDRYFDCKARFFTDHLAAAAQSGKQVKAVINLADPRGRDLKDRLALPVLTTGGPDADVTLDNAVLDIRGIRGTLVTPSGSVAIDSSAIGAHNLENILSAAAAALAAGVSLDAIARGVRSFTVPGRLERVDNDRGFHVFVDYAHTPDGLLNVLRTLKPLTAGRLITVFGCGGDRDRTKRPKMGAIAETWSDVCIVTSDNPRTEHPNAIIDQIREGMTQNGHLIEPDRRRAIGLAIATARPGDAILIAGKGHETYQILNTGTIDFDDRIEAGKALDAHAH